MVRFTAKNGCRELKREWRNLFAGILSETLAALKNKDRSLDDYLLEAYVDIRNHFDGARLAPMPIHGLTNQLRLNDGPTGATAIEIDGFLRHGIEMGAIDWEAVPIMVFFSVRSVFAVGIFGDLLLQSARMRRVGVD